MTDRGVMHRIDGLAQDESDALLDFLDAHVAQPRFHVRWNWAPGQLAFWDNRCTLHNPVNDYHGFRREMHRITLAGRGCGF